MEKGRKLKVGDEVKDFELDDHNEKKFRLSDYKGKRVLLSFHPLAWTSVCAKQMQSLEQNLKTFDSLNTVAVGVSIDTVPSKKAWAKSLEIEHTSLLSDFWPHGEVAKMLGIFREKNGFSERVNIILDESQRIAFFKIYELGKLPDINEIIEFIKKMK
jgi:peroxiredoxin